MAGAKMTFLNAERTPTETQTDAQGRYRLYVLARELSIGCQGVPDRYYTTGSQNVTIAPGQQVEGFDFKLPSAPRIRGEVVFPDGRKAEKGLHVCVLASWSDTRPLASFNGAFLRFRRDFAGPNGRPREVCRLSSQSDGASETQRNQCVRMECGRRRAGTASVRDVWQMGSVLKVVLTETGSATLLVLDPAGKGVPGAKIRVWPSQATIASGWWWDNAADMARGSNRPGRGTLSS